MQPTMSPAIARREELAAQRVGAEARERRRAHVGLHADRHRHARRSGRGRASRPSPPSTSSRAPCRRSSAGFVRPSKPRSPSFLNTSCAGNSSAASHSSTCGLISASMKRFSVRWISSCSWVISMAVMPPGLSIKAGPRRTASAAACAASRLVAHGEHEARARGACRAGRSRRRRAAGPRCRTRCVWRSKVSTIFAFSAASFASSTGSPLRRAPSRITISIVPAACSAPITAVRAFGQLNTKRGAKPRPHMP